MIQKKKDKSLESYKKISKYYSNTIVIVIVINHSYIFMNIFIMIKLKKLKLANIYFNRY